MSASLCEEHSNSKHSYSYFETNLTRKSSSSSTEMTAASTPLGIYASFAALIEPTDYLNQKALEGLTASEIIIRATKKDIDSSDNTTITTTTALQKPNSLNQKALDELRASEIIMCATKKDTDSIDDTIITTTTALQKPNSCHSQ
ncbi:hypothetical protein RDI58_002869 [Solanum bulbocastanum]|uniref:Uncharacterized protein n=1 Tax=Solanum bulbocastanum TaxID=147425 RepID=A0AAN8UEA8_SOLBU